MEIKSAFISAVAGFSLAGLSAPKLLAEQDLQSKNKSESATLKLNLAQLDAPASEDQVYQALSAFRDKIYQIYKDNGKPQTSIEKQISRFVEAMGEVLSALEPGFNLQGFEKLKLRSQCDEFDRLLSKYDFMLASCDFGASTKDGNKAYLSICIDRIISKQDFNCSERDFSIIGCPKNVLPTKVQFIETQAVIQDAAARPAAPPISAMISSKDVSIILGHDNLSFYLPKYRYIPEFAVDLKLKDFLTDWALGRLTYQLSVDQRTNVLPESIEIGNQIASLRGSMGLHYALEKCNELTPEIAIVCFNFLSINVTSPDNLQAVLCSDIVRQVLSQKYPGIDKLNSNFNASDFLNQQPKAAVEYLTALKAMLKIHVDMIKDQSSQKTNQKKQSRSI